MIAKACRATAKACRGTAKALVLLTLALSASAETADEIVRKAVAQYGHNQEVLSNYTYEALSTEKDLDRKGNVKATHTGLEDVMYIGGRIHRRKLEKDGKPLSADDARREQEALDRAVREAEKLTPEDRKAREQEGRKQRARESMSHIPEAMEMKVVAQTAIDGRRAWQIHLSPKRDYRGPDALVLRHMEGDLWIDQQDYAWVRIEADALDTISFGFFLARIAKGTRVSLERVRLNDEVWALRRLQVKASARIALVKSVNEESEVTFRNYRRFRTDSRLLETDKDPL